MNNISVPRSTYEKVKSGEIVKCHFCKNGYYKSTGPHAIACDKCGKGIVARIHFKLDD